MLSCAQLHILFNNFYKEKWLQLTLVFVLCR